MRVNKAYFYLNKKKWENTINDNSTFFYSIESYNTNNWTEDGGKVQKTEHVKHGIKK